jgi:single-strand DNA-binding protein
VQATFPKGSIKEGTDMSGYLNRVQLIGNLGRDPEVRTTQSGKTVVTLVIATGESLKDERGNRVEKTEWHRIVIFSEGLGQIAEKYLEKGSKVYLEGKLCTRKWQDQSGADRYSTEIHLTPYNGVLIFLNGRRDGGPAAVASTADSRAGAVAGTHGNLDDEIPF